MNLSDLTCIEISPEMKAIAKHDSLVRAENKGQKTREQIGDVKRDYGDILGSLGEQVVDIAGTNLIGSSFKSYHTVQGSYGDPYDHLYEDDKIDTKAHRGNCHNPYFYNESFLVLKSTADKIARGEKGITHYCFVLIDRENLDHACIYGVIPVFNFMQIAQPVKLDYDNYGIKAWELIKYGQPFVNYIFRNRATSD